MAAHFTASTSSACLAIRTSRYLFRDGEIHGGREETVSVNGAK